MPKVMICSTEWKEILRKRRALGHDRKDEVWNGVYFMAPDPTNSHQRLTSRIEDALEASAPVGSNVQAGGNVSDRKKGWKLNFRCPDVMVFLPGNPAEDCETHYVGGPDFLVEVVSPGDRSEKKLGFYASVGVREVLLVDQGKARITLYKRDGEGWAEPVTAKLDEDSRLQSDVLPVSFSFQSVAGDKRPHVFVRHLIDGRIWDA